MLRCPADQPGVELGASDLASVEKQLGHGATQPSKWVHSSVVRAADCRSAGPWFKSGCALCFHDGLSLQGLRLMLTKRVEGWSGASLRFQPCCAELSCGGLTGVQCSMLCGPKT